MRTFEAINKKKFPEPRPKLCKHCGSQFFPRTTFQSWCSSECGYEIAKKKKAKKDKEQKSKDRKELKEMKIETHSKEFKADFQRDVNRLARLIDSHFELTTCIDCDKPFGKQTDAAHFHSRSGNSSLRWNLHNLHSAASHCNQFSDKHKQGYEVGLSKRYGPEYSKYVIEELPLIYKRIEVSNKQIYEKLALVRSLIRNFNTFELQNPIHARNLFNILIGIYTNNFK